MGEGKRSHGSTVVFQPQFVSLRSEASLYVVINNVGFRGMKCGVREAGACHMLQQSHGDAGICWVALAARPAVVSLAPLPELSGVKGIFRFQLINLPFVKSQSIELVHNLIQSIYVSSFFATNALYHLLNTYLGHSFAYASL